MEKDIHSTGVKRKREKRRTGRIKEQQERNSQRSRLYEEKTEVQLKGKVE